MPTPLILRLFSFFDCATIVRLSKVGIRLRAVYRWYCNQVWDPSKIYQEWFMDPPAFRLQLRYTGAIISGSFALQFFDRVRYPGSDMDIFVRVGGAQQMCTWIVEQGYRYGNEMSNAYYIDGEDHGVVSKCVANSSSFENAVLGVYNFVKLVGWRDESVHLMHVQVIVVDTDPIEHMLFDFHSTAVMNFLTATEAISVFPKPTFLERVSYISKIRSESDKRTEGWRNKYINRGYRLVGAEQFGTAGTIPLGTRHVLDRNSWILKFTGLPPSERPIYGSQKLDVRFDVLSRNSGVVAPGSHIRIAEPYIWKVPGVYQ